MIKALVLDLDDTIYLEREYVQSGFRAVAEYLEEEGVTSADAIFDSLWGHFSRGGRGDAFDRLMEQFDIASDTASVNTLVSLYRDHDPRIGLAEPGPFSELLNAPVVLALISDGWLDTQKAKLRALDLDDSFSAVVFTDQWGRDYWKPHHRAFERVERDLGLDGKALAYVADNPAKDFIAPNQREWLTVRLRLPGQLHYADEPEAPTASPAREVSSLAQLLDLL